MGRFEWAIWQISTVERLLRRETVEIRPRGHSMTGKVDDGDTVTLVPAADLILNLGDVVLVRVSVRDYLHLIKAVSRNRFQIDNNRGGINGWVMQRSIYGKAINVEG